VLRIGGSDQRKLDPRQAWPHPQSAGRAHEHAQQVEPVTLVPHIDAAVPGGAARGHDPIFAEVQPVVTDGRQVCFDRGEPQRRIGHHVVECFHPRGLGHWRQSVELDLAGTGRSAVVALVESRVRRGLCH
jgi:hypothetical protein